MHFIYSRKPEIETATLSQCDVGLSFSQIQAYFFLFRINSIILTKHISNINWCCDNINKLKILVLDII